MSNKMPSNRLVVEDAASARNANNARLLATPHIRIHYSKSDFSGCSNFKNYSPPLASSALPSTNRPSLTVAYSEDNAATGSSTCKYTKKNRTNLINQKRTLDGNLPLQSFYVEQSHARRPDLYGNGNYYRYSISTPLKRNVVDYSSENQQYNNTGQTRYIPYQFINAGRPLENRYHFVYDKNIIDNVPLEPAVELATRVHHYKAGKSLSQLAYFQNRSDCSISTPGREDFSSLGETGLTTTTCNQKRAFYRHSTIMMRTKNVPQNQKQLSVPEIRVRSLSTPSSPDPTHNNDPQRRYVVKNLNRNTSIDDDDDDDNNDDNVETFQEARRGEKPFLPHFDSGRRVARYSMDNAVAAMDYAASKMTLESMKSRSATSSTARLRSQSPAFRRRLPLTPNQNPIEFVVSPPPSVNDLTPNEQPMSVASTPRTSYLMVANPDSRQRSNSLQMSGEISFGKGAFGAGPSGTLGLPSQLAPLKRRGTGRKLPQAPSEMLKNSGQDMVDEPKLPVRKESHQLDCPLFSSANGKMCRRRTSEQSMEQYIATTCTCSSFSDDKSDDYKSVSPESSSDTEDQTGISSYSSLASVKKPSLQNDSGFSSDAIFEQPCTIAVPIPDRSATPVEKHVEEHKPPTDDKDHGLGVLHFTGQYFPVRKRLRINVHKAENLAGQLRPDMELHTFIKMYLNPGKLHKQNGSRVVKNSRNAVYNEELFFDNLSETDINNLSIVIKVCHMVKKQFQKKDIAVGAIVEPLASLLTSKKEVKFVRHLKPKHIKKLGRIRLSTCLEAEARRLTINIFKVDNLPKFGICGAPDPYIRITINQNGRIQHKQTRILKGTQSAVFKEAVMFLVSVRPEDLDNADIEIAVIDAARQADATATHVSSQDDAIGYVYLGKRAKEKLEHEQWMNTVKNPGKEIRGMHMLRLDDED